MSLTLSQFLSNRSNGSEFEQNLPEQGGHLVFSNSGRRGETKRFALPLESIGQCLKDLLNNSAKWKKLTNYDEKTWRDFGSEFFLDPVANALSTVQTKPVFITLARIIEWANEKTGQNDNSIGLDKSSIETAIQKIEALELQYRPRKVPSVIIIDNKLFAPYLAAIRTKPFILLAGISGTGKSRLVRQLAKATCSANLADAQKPGNFEMIQVRPNWHDSTELMGYISRISGEHYVLTDFVRFLAKAWLFKETPFFLCLDEMNLAPVEQYFAEYLSVIETRRKDDGTGEIVTDVIVKFPPEVIDAVLIQVFSSNWAKPEEHGKVEALKTRFKNDGGIRIPPNLVVMGTVNMDETTFSFSRKVLDRAMSFELNEVNLREGLTENKDAPEIIEASLAEGHFVSAADVHAVYEDISEKVIAFLEAVNAHLENTPFKIAYRSRNEMMIYAVERMTVGNATLATALDEATAMKILPRIEGDEQKIPKDWLEQLTTLIENKLKEADPDYETDKSVSITKLEQMKKRLESGYVSFWS